MTGPEASYLQISMSSSLFGALKKTNSEPRGEVCLEISSSPNTFV